jgi:hypothetical protein
MASQLVASRVVLSSIESVKLGWNVAQFQIFCHEEVNIAIVKFPSFKIFLGLIFKSEIP